jgi:ABC-type dipeptide/oligopeptide/nickel transport system ATPase component
MRYGELLEVADRAQFVGHPAHSYTRTLRDAVPEIGRPLPDELGRVADGTSHHPPEVLAAHATALAQPGAVR